MSPLRVERKEESEFAQSCSTLCHPMDCNLPGSSVPGISQARMLEWVAVSFPRRSSQSRNQTQVLCVSCLASRFFTTEPPRKPIKEDYKDLTEKAMAPHSSNSCLENPMDGGAW